MTVRGNNPLLSQQWTSLKGVTFEQEEAAPASEHQDITKPDSFRSVAGFRGRSETSGDQDRANQPSDSNFNSLRKFASNVLIRFLGRS